MTEFFLNNLPYQSVFLLNVIIICLIAGTFLTPASATIILTPILFPTSQAFGIDPDTLRPEIHQVGNGFISVAGYHAQGSTVITIP